VQGYDSAKQASLDATDLYYFYPDTVPPIRIICS